MSISKGKLFVGFEELERLFGLPKGVEILSVEQGLDGFDFKLASSEDVNVGDVKVTYKQERGINTYRRLGLQRLHNALNQEIVDLFKPDIDEVIKSAIKEHRIDKQSGYADGVGKMMLFANPHERILSEKDANTLLDAQNLLKTIDSISFKDLPKLKIPKVDELFPVEVKVEIEKAQDIFQQALDNIQKKGK